MKYVCCFAFLWGASVIAHKEYLHRTRWIPAHNACEREITWLNSHEAGTEEFAWHLKAGWEMNYEESHINAWIVRESFLDPLWTDVWRNK